LFLTRSFALCRKITLVSYIRCVRDKHNANRVAKRDRRSYFEKFSGYNDDRGSTISYFPVLKLGKLHQNLKTTHVSNSEETRNKNAKKNSFLVHLGSRMLHFQHLENRSTVVGDCDVTNVVDEHLKKARSESIQTLPTSSKI